MFIAIYSIEITIKTVDCMKDLTYNSLEWHCLYEINYCCHSDNYGNDKGWGIFLMF